MHVGLAFDEQYVGYAAVTIDSVLDHNTGIDIWIVGSGVSGCIVAIVTRAVNGRADVQFLHPPSEWCDFALSRRADLSCLSTGMYYRLAFADLMPDDVDRRLYLDSDTMCMGKLSPL